MQKTILLILDGWGLAKDSDHNAIFQAKPPFWNHLVKNYPTSHLHAREESVGLTKGCLSGSEVGHTIIGAGRVVWQQVSKIDKEIESGEFYNNQTLKEIKEHADKYNSTVHLMGILTDAGIHAHISHLNALIEWAKKNNLKSVALHLFLDGRDMSPMSAKKLLVPLLKNLNDKIEISVMCGRDILDRNENWSKTSHIFRHLTEHKDKQKITPLEYIDKSYAENVTDEFMVPANFSDKIVKDNDAIIFFNFRADRMRQVVKLFMKQAPHAVQSEVLVLNNLLCASMSEYGDIFTNVKVLYPKEIPINSLGEWLSLQGLNQFRITEGEKYAHITYFFNGGREVAFKNESRLVVPSLGLSNYATQPEMSLAEVTKILVRAIEDEKYDFVVCNIANGDMVGHSGEMEAAMKAVMHVDNALSQIIERANKHGYTVVITADHGNVESMVLENEPHTSHTFNDVPLIVTNPNIKLTQSGFLHQIAPTVLEIMGVEQPKEMDSTSVIKK